MLRKAAVAGTLAALLLGAPAAYADGEEQETSPLIVASTIMTSEFAVPAEDVEDLRAQLQGGFLREDFLGCLEHPETRVVVDGTQEEQCEPAAIVTTAVENGQTSGLGVRFEGVDYHVDLVSDRDTESGPVLLGPDLPETGVDKGAAASSAKGAKADAAAESENGVSLGTIAGFGALVLVGAGAGVVALRRK